MNTLGTTNGTLITQRTLSTLFTMFPLLRGITTDFSAEPIKLGQTVMSHVVVPSAAVDFVQNDGYAATGMTQIDVPVVINRHIHHTYEVLDTERSSTDIDLVERFAQAGAHALGTRMLAGISDLITAANFTLQHAVAPANFDRDDVVKGRTILNKNNVPDMGRFMLLNSDCAEGLGIDTTIVGGINNPGVTTLQDGKLPRIHGFDVSEWSALPENDEKLIGFAGNKEALVVATRLPATPADKSIVPGIIRAVTEPFSGFTVQLRSWYNMDLAKELRTVTLMFGAAVGLSAAGECKRLVRYVKP